MNKKISIYIIALAAGLSFAGFTQAQDTTEKKTKSAVKKTATKVGNKTAEIASKAKSDVVDKVYDGKVGPGGQKIYIDGKSKYYYVDKKGHKKYVKENKLKNK